MSEEPKFDVDCRKCGRTMRFVKVNEEDAGLEAFTFKCLSCNIWVDVVFYH